MIIKKHSNGQTTVQGSWSRGL